MAKKTKTTDKKVTETDENAEKTNQEQEKPEVNSDKTADKSVDCHHIISDMLEKRIAPKMDKSNATHNMIVHHLQRAMAYLQESQKNTSVDQEF